MRERAQDRSGRNSGRGVWTGGIVSFFLLFGWVAAAADPPPGYYDSAEGLSGLALRVAVHEIIDDHTRFPYTSGATDTWDIVHVADEDPGNSSNVRTIYKNESIPKSDHTPSGFNREHSWPNSYGFSQDGSCNYAYTDCHQLFACDWGYNSTRGNKPFDDCLSGCSTLSVDDFPSEFVRFMGSGNQGAWEVFDSRKGDLARAMFYMDVRYEGGVHGGTSCTEPDLILTDNRNLISADASSNFSPAYMGILSTLIEWHLADPVDQKERDRNDVIFGFQGNRNPFVDRPEWVCEIWSCTPDMIPPAMPMGLMASADPCSVTLDWLDNSDGDLAGYHVYRGTQSGGSMTRINGTLLFQSDYVDGDVIEGMTFFYTVTAVDLSNNESVASAEASAGPSGTGCTAASRPWINEFHYDNDSNDTREGIEIAGPAGSSLSGWSLVGYNGNGGAAYMTVNLSGALPDQENGFGTLWFPFLGLQNGGPDGMALVDDSGQVVEFLSYEGTFIAQGGPASGMTSVSVGVSEPSNSPVGHSLQLMGSGNRVDDFTWEAPGPHTEGLPNRNQTFLPDVDFACRTGNVGLDDTGSPNDVLFVNGSAGTGPERVVTMDATTALEVFLTAAPAGPPNGQHAVWVWKEAPDPAVSFTLPFGLGDMCLDPLNSTCDPCAMFAAKSIPGRCGAVLCSTVEATGATPPAVILRIPAGTLLPGDKLWVQGVIKDSGDTSGRRVSVTNGVEVHIQ